MHSALVVPAIDLIGGRVVRLHQGRYDRLTEYSADPVELAQCYLEQGASRIHVIDLDAARTGVRPTAHARLIARLAELRGLEVVVGGGVREPGHVLDLLETGAARVIVGSLAATDPAVVGELARRTGRVIVAADSRGGRVRVEGWERDSGLSVERFVLALTAAGVPDFLVTSIDRDGTGRGPDIALLLRLRPLIDGELTAAGGIATLGHVTAAARLADSVAIGRALLDGELTYPHAAAAACGPGRPGSPVGVTRCTRPV
jgi:phosphoribosylformimino-5-aminoimidazole carboxamide ribotide isomerase